MGPIVWTEERVDRADDADKREYIEHLAKTGALGELEGLWDADDAGTHQCSGVSIDELLKRAQEIRSGQ